MIKSTRAAWSAGLRQTAVSAVVFAGLWGAAAAQQEAFCENPASVCAAELSPGCSAALIALGAGSIPATPAPDPSCDAETAAYRSCLERAVAECERPAASDVHDHPAVLFNPGMGCEQTRSGGPDLCAVTPPQVTLYSQAVQISFAGAALRLFGVEGGRAVLTADLTPRLDPQAFGTVTANGGFAPRSGVFILCAEYLLDSDRRRYRALSGHRVTGSALGGALQNLPSPPGMPGFQPPKMTLFEAAPIGRPQISALAETDDCAASANAYAQAQGF